MSTRAKNYVASKAFQNYFVARIDFWRLRSVHKVNRFYVSQLNKCSVCVGNPLGKNSSKAWIVLKGYKAVRPALQGGNVLLVYRVEAMDGNWIALPAKLYFEKKKKLLSLCLREKWKKKVFPFPFGNLEKKSICCGSAQKRKGYMCTSRVTNFSESDLENSGFNFYFRVESAR